MSKSFQVGDRASLSKAFSEEDVLQFARLSTDMSPVYIDREYAAGSMFGQPIVHGTLVCSLFSALLEQQLPGEGTISLSQDVEFKAPVYIDEEVTASVEVSAIDHSKPIIFLKLSCVNSRGIEVISGTAKTLSTHVRSAGAEIEQEKPCTV